MSQLPENFTKEKQFIVCVDSDGCAMDTMDIKHERFFGPLAAEEFGIQNKEAWQKNWERVNLFSSTRGVNRFTALAMCLEDAKEAGEEVGDISNLAKWVNEASSLSNGSLEEAIKENSSDDLKKALSWSQKVNQGIEEELAGEDKPFDGAKEGLAAIAELADVAIVSSANSEALDSEWNRHGLMQYVDVVYGQESGSKKDAIADLLSKGYGKDEVLMVGDAPGDLKAAQDNGVAYYPILFGKEKSSWERLKNEALGKFLNKDYAEMNNQVTKEFNDHLAQYD